MTPFAEAALQRILGEQLGVGATFSRYVVDPEDAKQSPLSVAIREAEQAVGPIAVYWVRNSPAALFALPGFTPPAIAYSTRYLTLTGALRHLFTMPSLRGNRAHASEGAALRLMAEQALRAGRGDSAALWLAHAVVVDVGVVLADGDDLDALEAEPITEAYIATWFYPLLHEVGHLHPSQAPAAKGYPHLTADALAGFVEAGAVELGFPADLVAEARRRVDHPHSVLSLDTLRSESIADAIAAELLLGLTNTIFRLLGKGKADLDAVLWELTIARLVLGTIDRCQRMVDLSDPQSKSEYSGTELRLHPLAMFVRASVQREHFFASGIRSGALTEKESVALRVYEDRISSQLADVVGDVDRGIVSAGLSCVSRRSRTDAIAQLEGLRATLRESPVAGVEIARFLRLASSLDVSSQYLELLADAAADPDAPLDFIAKSRSFIVPWIVAADSPAKGAGRPFGLDTRHGHLVFVFAGQSARYDAFFEVSAGALNSRFSLTTAALLVANDEEVAPTLAESMPPGPFRVSVEGTKEFEQHMCELADETISD